MLTATTEQAVPDVLSKSKVEAKAELPASTDTTKEFQEATEAPG